MSPETALGRVPWVRACCLRLLDCKGGEAGRSIKLNKKARTAGHRSLGYGVPTWARVDRSVSIASARSLCCDVKIGSVGTPSLPVRCAAVPC